ncbi:hypothetical protein G6F58_012818 [Rhizopus delemar]|nr:hypothetical protein G6F58_012818 [Rhizopus delemar]
MAQADLRQHFVHPHPVFAAGQLQRQRDVLGGGQRRQQVEALEHEADLACAQLGAGFLVETAQILAGQRNAAAAGQVQPGQQAEQGGLAGTGFAHDGHDFAGVDVQVDAVQHAVASLLAEPALARPGRGGRRCGKGASSWRVYSCAGAASTCEVGPVSTISPRRITTMRCA